MRGRYADGGEVKVNGMTKQDYIDAFNNRIEKLIQKLKEEGRYDENDFDYLHEIDKEGGFTDIEEVGFWLSTPSKTNYFVDYLVIIDYVNDWNDTLKVLSNFYFGKPIKIGFVLETGGDTDLGLEDELQKIKLLSTKIDFNKVLGFIDYDQSKDNTDLDFYKDAELVMTLKGDWNESTEELDATIDVNSETAEFNYHPRDGFGNIDFEQLEKNINEAFRELNTYSAVVSIEGYEEYAEDVEGLENARNVIQNIKGNTRFQVLKGSSVGIGKRVDDSRVIEEFAKGGEAGFDDAGTSMAMYHEKKGNWLSPKGQVYLWLYDVEDSGDKMQSGEFDYVFYPLTSMSMAWQSGYIPPLKRIWTKKFQKDHKGSEHLLGVIKAYLIEKEGKKELYIDMMSVNPKKKKKGIMSYMIKDLRDSFDLSQDQITFSKLTPEGEKFVAKKTYADGGVAEKIHFFVVNDKNDKNYGRVGYVLDETETITDKEGNEFEKLNFENQKVAKKYNVKDLVSLEQRDTFIQKDTLGDTEYVILVNYDYSKRPYYYLYNVTKKFVATEGSLDWVKSSLPKGWKFYDSYADGGNVPHEDKMFQLPLEMVVYVPSTQDVDKVISVDKMATRVDEVKEYLASKFGGYTSADKLGGFVDSTGNLVNEDVVQVTAFATKEAYAEYKEELIHQLALWGKKWGQEAIGFEFEGDLMYVPQEL